MARLAVPLVVVQVGYTAMGFVDTAVAGQMDPLSLAATGLGTSVFFVVSVLGLGVVLGLDPLASQAFGAGEPRAARRAMWQGVYAAALMTLPLSVVALALAPSLGLFGVQPTLAPVAADYLYGRVPSLLPMLVSVALRSYLQAAHVTRVIIVSTLVANVFNFAADWLLAFGDAGLVRLGLPALGLPALGVVGLALASTVSAVAQTAVMMWAVRGLQVPPGPDALRRPNAKLIKKIVVVGAPIGLMLLAEVGIFALVQVLIARLSVSATAAHQVALMFASLSFSVCLGIGAATSVEVGRAIGRGEAAATRRAGVAGMLLGGGFMVASGMVLALWPASLARVMNVSDEVMPLAVELLRIAAMFQLADGVQAVGAGALRGAGITRWGFVANVVAYWGVGLPVALWLGFGLELGAPGLWWGLTAGLVVAAVALSFKFVRVTRGDVARLRLQA